MGMSSNRDNVVKLQRGQSSPIKNELSIKEGLSKLPAVVQLIHDLSHTRFKNAIQNLFDHVDDSIFELADKAESNVEQNIFFESMREIRIHRRDMERAFLRDTDTHFVDVLSGCETKTEPADPGVADVNKLSLVAKDELEEFVAVDSLVKKAWFNNKAALGSLGGGLSTIEALAPIAVNNLLTPRSLSDNFVNAASVLTIDIKAKLVLFKLFDRYVMQELPNVLTLLNQSLKDQGVSAPKPSLRRRASPPQGDLDNNDVDNGVSASHSANIKQAPAPDTATLYGTLQNLLQSQPQQKPRAGFSDSAYDNNMEGDYGVSIALINALSQIQQQQVQQASLFDSGGVQPVLLSNGHIKTAIELVTGETLIDKHSQDVMKLVDMLFSFILEDENLPDPIKLLLARLQIPFIKVALADEGFFKKEGHPARRLLNEMAMASIGWSGDRGVQKRDPLLTKIEATVARVLEEFDTNFELFTLLLTDFIAFIEKERRRVLLFEKRAIDAEAGKAKSELGRQYVDKKLDELIRAKNIPEVFETFIRGPWSNILFLIYMRQGPEGKQWANGINIASELLWSALPIKDDNHKNKLNSLLPRMNVALTKSLESISFNPAQQTHFLDGFHRHYNALFLHYKKKLHEESNKVNRVEGNALNDERVIGNNNIVNNKSIAEPTELLEKVTESRPAGDGIDVETITGQAEVKVSESVQAEIGVEENTTKDKPNKKHLKKQTHLAEQQVISQPALAESDNSTLNQRPKQSPKQPLSGKELLRQASQAPQQAEAQYINLVDNFTVGMWFEKQDDDIVSCRCRLAAIIRGAAKYIFVNRAGVKVAEETRETLALQLQQGKVRILDDGMLFDRALESVITHLRAPK